MNHKYLLSTLLISTALFTLKSQTLDDARSWYRKVDMKRHCPSFNVPTRMIQPKGIESVAGCQPIENRKDIGSGAVS